MSNVILDTEVFGFFCTIRNAGTPKQTSLNSYLNITVKPEAF